MGCVPQGASARSWGPGLGGKHRFGGEHCSGWPFGAREAGGEGSELGALCLLEDGSCPLACGGCGLHPHPGLPLVVPQRSRPLLVTGGQVALREPAAGSVSTGEA